MCRAITSCEMKALNPRAEEWWPASDHSPVASVHPPHSPVFFPFSLQSRLILPHLQFYHPFTHFHGFICYPPRPFYHSPAPSLLPNVEPLYVEELTFESKPKLRVRATKNHQGKSCLPSRLRKTFSGGKKKKSGNQSGVCTDQGIPPFLKTTVMIKNIPNKLRRDFMLSFLDQYCDEHGLEYDFFYLPMDFGRKDNLGYAFVNFTTADAAKKFQGLLQNYRWETIEIEKGSFIRSKKICETTWATIQGKQRLVKRFQDSIFACDKPEYLPVVLDPPRNGVESDPAPPRVIGKLSRWSI